MEEGLSRPCFTLGDALLSGPPFLLVLPNPIKILMNKIRDVVDGGPWNLKIIVQQNLRVLDQVLIRQKYCSEIRIIWFELRIRFPKILLIEKEAYALEGDRCLSSPWGSKNQH